MKRKKDRKNEKLKQNTPAKSFQDFYYHFIWWFDENTTTVRIISPLSFRGSSSNTYIHVNLLKKMKMIMSSISSWKKTWYGRIRLCRSHSTTPIFAIFSSSNDRKVNGIKPYLFTAADKNILKQSYETNRTN